MIARLAERLAGVTLSLRLAGIILALWAASLAALWAYAGVRQGFAVEAAASVAKAEAQAKCSEDAAEAAKAAQLAQAEAIKQARAEWQAAQAEVDRLAAEDRARIERDLIAARVRADNLFRTLQAHIHAKPLPVACRLDAERVRLYNAARLDPATAPD